MIVRQVVRDFLSQTWASSVFSLIFIKFSSLRAKIEYFEVKMVPQPSQCLTLVETKNFSMLFQNITGASRHFIRIISIRKSKRNDHTTNISILNRENVSYGSFLGVQKDSEGFWRGFCTEFNKNTPKRDENSKTTRPQSTWKNFLLGSSTQPKY